MWTPNDEIVNSQGVYHPHKETPSQPYPPHWYRYQNNNIDQSESGLIDYSSDMPADMHHHSRDVDRPFKAYSRNPVTMASSYYGSQPTFPSSLPLDGGRDYSHVTSTCSSSSVPPLTSINDSSAHSHLPPHRPLRGPVETATSRTSPDIQPNSQMLKISNTMSLKPESLESRDSLHGNDSSSDSNTSPQMAASPNDSDTGNDRTELNGFRMPPKKRPHTVPDTHKDDTYWEKRKKNNESAKRSREARRMKEEQIAMRVVYLEQENLQLRTELSLLKNEIEKLRCMLYNS